MTTFTTQDRQDAQRTPLTKENYMNARQLADWLQDKTIYLWDSGDEQYYASPICEDIVPTLRELDETIARKDASIGHLNSNIEALEKQNSYLMEYINFNQDMENFEKWARHWKL